MNLYTAIHKAPSSAGAPGGGMAVFALGVLMGFPGAGHQPLELVESLDLQRYQGRWYEIARPSNRFQDR